MSTSGGRPAAATRPKAGVSDLAIFGGPRLFDEPRYVGRPNVGDRHRFRERVEAILDSRWLTNGGPVVREFETAVSRIVGAEHCIATSNATVGLQVALRAAGVSGEVLMPSFTFAATAHAAAWLGMDPVLCDVEATSHCIDPRDVEAQIAPRSAAILGVHLWGNPCAMDDLEAIAARHGIPLIVDAAHAFGCSRRGRMVGAGGKAEVFSFHATKFVNSFEGGVIATNDDELASVARRMVNFGFAGDDRNARWIGTNAKMPEVCGAMGLTSLESMPAFVEHNRADHTAYRTALADTRGVRLLTFDETERNNYQFVVVEISPAAGIGRDQLLRVLRSEGVIAQAYCSPAVHQMPTYSGRAQRPLPVSERLAREVLVLPTGTATSVQDVHAICDLIQFVIVKAEDIGARLRPVVMGAEAP